nr:iron ABC transporter permease [Nocardioides daedukensis]
MVLLLALVTVCIGSLLIGSTSVSPAALLDPDHADRAVIIKRWDRTLLGLLVGAAFALAGACMQGLTRNPLADPGLLGVNAGASFGIVTAIAWLGASSALSYLWFGLLGAAVATVVVHLVASFGRLGATPAKLAVAGAALSAGVGSWTTAVLLTDQGTFDQIRRWQVGSVAGRPDEVLMTCLPFLAVGGLIALASIRILNALALGEDLARGLGRRTARDRLLVGAAIVLLAGAGTAVAGPIAFIGLIVPHLVRALVGPDYSRVLPFSLGYGAVLVVASDTVGRVVLPPGEVPVGVMATVIGVPVFLWLVARRRMGGL